MTAIKNMDGLFRKIDGIKREVNTNIANVLLDAAITVKSEAQRLVQERSNGEKQIRYRNGKRREVVASLPGDPPNTDTGKLVRSLKARIVGPREAAAAVDSSIAPHGKYLEYGTHNMEPRPFMRRAYYNKREVIKSKLKVLGRRLVDEAIR